MRKKWLLVLLLLVTFGLSACSTSSSSSSSTSNNSSSASSSSAVLTSSSSSVAASTFVERQTKTSELTIFRYYLYTPANPVAGLPLIVYLHGGSGRGDSLSLITDVDGFPKYLRDGQLGAINAYVLIPQVPSSKKGWPEIQTSLDELIDYTVNVNKINKLKIALTGHSMGGTGTWSIALQEASRFHKIAPLSGSITTDATTLAALQKSNVWAMVGSADTIVDPTLATTFITELQKTNANAKITIFEGATHFDVPALAYLNRELGLIDWLLN